MKVTSWTDWDDSRYKELPNDLLESAKYAVIKELRHRGYKITGGYHQNGDYGVPVINGRYLAKYTQRHWGWLMAKAYPEEIDNRDNLAYTVWAWLVPDGEEMVVPGEG